MCKPPEWCKIEASHRRFYYVQKESYAGRKGPAGENPRTAPDGEWSGRISFAKTKKDMVCRSLVE